MKYISLATGSTLIIATAIATVWVLFVTPPCKGSYDLKIGGQEYFLFQCENKRPGSDPIIQPAKPYTFEAKIPDIHEMFDGDLIIHISKGTTPHRVGVVLSSPSIGEIKAWTAIRENELSQTSSVGFNFQKQYYKLFIKNLPTNPSGTVVIVVQQQP